MRVFDLSVSEMLWSRRTIFMALVVGAPVLIALFLRMLDAFGAPVFRVNNAMMAGPAICGLMIWVFYLRFTVPVLGVFYGTSLIADEVEDKTITYLLTRPIPKGAVLMGKYFAYLACPLFVVLPSVVIVYLSIVPMRGNLGASFLDLLKDLGLLELLLALFLRQHLLEALAKLGIHDLPDIGEGHYGRISRDVAQLRRSRAGGGQRWEAAAVVGDESGTETGNEDGGGAAHEVARFSGHARGPSEGIIPIGPGKSSENGRQVSGNAQVTAPGCTLCAPRLPPPPTKTRTKSPQAIPGSRPGTGSRGRPPG